MKPFELKTFTYTAYNVYNGSKKGMRNIESPVPYFHTSRKMKHAYIKILIKGLFEFLFKVHLTYDSCYPIVWCVWAFAFEDMQFN